MSFRLHHIYGRRVVTIKLCQIAVKTVGLTVGLPDIFGSLLRVLYD